MSAVAMVSSGYKVKTFPYPSMEADTTPDEEEEDNSCCTRLQGEMFKWLTSLFAAHVATPHSPTSPLDTSSSATMSPLYPDRPIRPMPKRSIKARLSSEVADTIDYPPAPASSNNMFYSYPDSVAQRNGAAIRNALREIDNVMYGPQDETELDDKQSHRFKGNDPDSEDEGDSGFVRHYENYQHRPGIMPAVSRASANGMSRNAEAVPRSVASSADSADGYDSFENTNNKKKRKIPTSGNAGNHHSAFSASLSQDLANMGLSNGDGVDTQEGSDAGLGHYYGSGSAATSVAASGTGISGAGRGRFGRSGRRDISGRGPLTSSMNSSNAWQNGRFTGLRRDQGSASSFGSKDGPSDHGIISQAIAEAAALPVMPNTGKENVSLLEQQSIKKTSPANTQFTFTCESDSSKGVVWPGENIAPGSAYNHSASTAGNTSVPYNPATNYSRKDFNTQGTQTSPSMANQQEQNGAAPQPGGQPQRKPRRSAAKRYAMAARDRRAQQEYNNYHHPPKPEDVWICEFCEYESIFGRAPEALIREYEIKDRKERKRLAEKRRLLEKAKMKGRKGKKGGKNTGKSNGNATQQQATQQNYNAAPDQAPLQSSGTQSDEYYGDEFDDDVSIPQPPPPPPETPTRIPQPVTQQPGQSARIAHGTGANRPG